MVPSKIEGAAVGGESQAQVKGADKVIYIKKIFVPNLN